MITIVFVFFAGIAPKSTLTLAPLHIISAQSLKGEY